MYQLPQKILITGENASVSFGGESILPFHYFRLLSDRGLDAYLVTHARCKNELYSLLPHLKDKMFFVEDTKFDLWLYNLGCKIKGLGRFIGWISLIGFQTKQKKIIKDVVSKYNIQIVHQVIPVSPKLPSFIYKVGCPVVIGPMNGGMMYPENFNHYRTFLESALVKIGRKCSHIINFLIPGKRKAQILIVANDRTRNALPRFINGSVAYLVENGIDLAIWKPRTVSFSKHNPVKFVFLGRLVDWKGVDFLLKAFDKANPQVPIQLQIIGDGPMRQEWEALASNIKGEIIFRGFIDWVSCFDELKKCDVLVLPSMYDCGGAVILEGMVSGLPIIATRWGGAIDYLDDKCGILVSPDNEKQFVNDLAKAMVKLANSPELRYSMGKAGQNKAISQFSWDSKINTILDYYETALNLSVPKK